VRRLDGASSESAPLMSIGVRIMAFAIENEEAMRIGPSTLTSFEENGVPLGKTETGDNATE
jgi:hypothetical protein